MVAIATLSPLRAEEPAPVRVGLIESLSGNLSPYSKEAVPAARYIFDQVNAQGGIKSLGGAKLELIVADDESDASKTASIARKLISEDHVSVLMGSLLTSQMLAISPVADELKVPTLSVWASSAKGDYVYTIGMPYDRAQADTMMAFLHYLAKRGVPIHNVATTYSNYEAGQQVNRALLPLIKSSDLTLAADVPLDLNSANQMSDMLRLRAANPDAVIGLQNPKNAEQLQRARFNLRYTKSIFLGTVAMADKHLWNVLGPDIAKAVLPVNTYGLAMYSSGVKYAPMQQVMAGLQKAYPDVAFSQFGFNSAQGGRIVQHVLELAASRDPEAIRDAFNKLKISPGDPDLYYARDGGISFGPDRTLTDSSLMVVGWTSEGHQVVVFPEKYAEVDPTKPR